MWPSFSIELGEQTIHLPLYIILVAAGICHIIIGVDSRARKEGFAIEGIGKCTNAILIAILGGGLVTWSLTPFLYSGPKFWGPISAMPGIIGGLATWGQRGIGTNGTKITELAPRRGFAAEPAAAKDIPMATRMGIPVSTTHILVGSVLGVGLARGIGALDLRVVGSIIVSWVATVPIAAALSVFFFYFFKGMLGP